MKFLSENITNFFSDKLTAQEISPKLIQLGHEHELSKEFLILNLRQTEETVCQHLGFQGI